jgi:hypothetical protein
MPSGWRQWLAPAGASMLGGSMDRRWDRSRPDDRAVEIALEISEH